MVSITLFLNNGTGFDFEVESMEILNEQISCGRVNFERDGDLFGIPVSSIAYYQARGQAGNSAAKTADGRGFRGVRDFVRKNI